MSSHHPPNALTYIGPLGLEVLYDGEHAYSSSLQTLGGKGTILNLQRGSCDPRLGGGWFSMSKM